MAQFIRIVRVDLSGSRIAIALLSLSLTSACYSIAPPIRMAHQGAPGRLGQGTYDIASAVTSVSGGETLGYGITEAIGVEGGIESNFTDSAIGFAGVRYTPLRAGRRKIAFVLDLEGGLGAGVGGTKCDAERLCSGPAQDIRRAAGGGYVGLGLGAKIHFFSPYLRIRQQLSAAEGVPLTSYTSALIGAQFALFESVHLWAGTGVLYLVTSEGNDNVESGFFGGWLTYDVGVSIAFGGWRQREALEQQSQRRARRGQAR